MSNFELFGKYKYEDDCFTFKMERDREHNIFTGLRSQESLYNYL